MLPLTERERFVTFSYIPRTRASRSDAAGQFRDQAAACRRLSGVARTPKGALALIGVAEQFDADARRMDAPSYAQ